MDTRHFWQIARFNGREEAAFVAGGWPGAAEKGDFITFIEMFLGGGPRAETKVLIGYFRDVIRKSLYEMGITVGGGIYLYDFPVWALDNTAIDNPARMLRFGLDQQIRAGIAPSEGPLPAWLLLPADIRH
jgi:hypothetical protein